eukprot:TRINITY_DN28163_c0_g1_i2.p1 TRINITY_DN28163_c0_g1~~TRINITY_DN28163_c0_g1_i2.p1  ORF type:complete len:405 (+),score=70.72 TRINITY_DN28163_c0_g1_i2:205-1419(+)
MAHTPEPKSSRRSSDENAMFEYWAGNPSVEINHGHINVSSRTADAGFAGGCLVLASSVPCHMAAAEFCDFLGAFGTETHRRFRHFRVLHGRNTEEYLMVILMASPEEAAFLIEQFHDKCYNALEPFVCHLHSVLSCQKGPPIDDSPSVRGRLRSPNPKVAMPLSPLLLPAAPPDALQRGILSSSPSPPLPECLPDMCSGVGLQSTLSPAMVACSGSDKPLCTVCLETVDANPSEYQLTELGGGVPLTILCGHTFHARCLSRWCDATCPVCRFQQYPYKTSSCDVCGHAEDVHVCLVCGFIGCTVSSGQGHAKQHFEATSHAYAMEVTSQHVWDYAGNGYVHRLIYNDQDGKMVEHTVPRADDDATTAGSAIPSLESEGVAPADAVSFGSLRWADMEEEIGRAHV